jgi:hypothetical protein
MAAAPGNKYNEKWDLETSKKFIDDVYQYVLDTKDCVSIGEACCELGQYEELISYLQNKHSEQDFKAIKKAKGLIGSRILKKGLKNEFNATMAIFTLKVNHDMQDKQVLETPDLKSIKGITFDE